MLRDVRGLSPGIIATVQIAVCSCGINRLSVPDPRDLRGIGKITLERNCTGLLRPRYAHRTRMHPRIRPNRNSPQSHTGRVLSTDGVQQRLAGEHYSRPFVGVGLLYDIDRARNNSYLVGLSWRYKSDLLRLSLALQFGDELLAGYSVGDSVAEGERIADKYHVKPMVGLSVSLSFISELLTGI
jgi:hypothetical protein